MSAAPCSRPTSAQRENNKVLVTSRDVDIGAELTAGKDIHLDPEEASRLRRKLDWRLLPLMCIVYLNTYVNRMTHYESLWLNIIQANHLSENQFDWLGRTFFLSYLVFIFPQSLALQRWPVGTWLSINIFLWSIALLFHAACKSFRSLLAAQFILGMCEGAIIPGFMIVMAMFYTRAEQVERTGYWFLMNGAAIILVDLVTLGCSGFATAGFDPWQWFFIIVGTVTFIISVLFWFLFPDSPTTARFLTPEERVKVVLRVRENQAGVENKTFKGEQFIEALTDLKTWLFVMFAACSTIWISLTDQRQRILELLGFSDLEVLFFPLADGAIEVVGIYLGMMFAARCKNAKAWTAIMSYAPPVVGTVLISTLSITNKTGLVVSYWISFLNIVPFSIFLSWVGMSTSGHTKRITVNALVLIASSAGSLAGPFIWKTNYAPRNRIPSSIISVCSVMSACTLFFIRQYLVYRNKVKDEQAAVQADREDKYNEVYITIMEGGRRVEKRVDRAFQDLTDLQNREFRYAL